MRHSLLLAFLDSNIVFSAGRSPTSPFLQFWQLPHVELLTSTHSMGEVRNNYESGDHERRTERLFAQMRIVSDRLDLPLPNGIILPPKDAPIYVAALAAGAQYLITGDKKHFRAYFNQNRSGLTVMEPVPFLRLLLPPA